MSNWVSLHNHSHYSLLDGLSKPVKIAERAAQLNMPAIALTDHGSISGIVPFINALKNVCECGHHKNSHYDGGCYGEHKNCKCSQFSKKNIKPILGQEIYLSSFDPTIKNPENRSLAHLVILAKNLEGWKQLIKLTSKANEKDNFYYKPRLNLDSLAEFCKDGNLIAISGHPGSEMANILFDNPSAIYNAKTYEEARTGTSGENVKRAIKLAEKYRDIFGKGNFFLESQRIDDKFAAAQLISNGMRYISKETGIPLVATGDSHFAYPEDFDDQRILLCSALQTNYMEVNKKIAQEEDFGLSTFFKSQKYYIPSPDEMMGIHTEEEVANSLLIADMCESYDIFGKPCLPTITGPDGISADKFLEKLCANGWRSKIADTIDNVKIDQYKERVRRELEVIKGANLSSYFLMVQDYCEDARKNGELVGPGRGSGAGCLVSYLIGITNIDPLKYDLLFERFYNAGRNTKDRVSLPDIDCDFEISKRHLRKQYIKNKYGADHVSEMVTFARLQGRASLKEVFRVKYPSISFDEVNRISVNIPDEAEISDQLQEMKEEGEEPSIIMWALENNAKDLKEYCYIDAQGKLQGEYAPAFKQAIRLEGVKKSQGKHAAGMVISSIPLASVTPMIYDKSSGEPIAGMEMNDLEALGLVKFDILGVACLDKLHGVQSLLAYGKVN